MSINKNRPIISYNNIALFQSDPYQLGNMTGANSGQNLNFLPFVESIDFAVIHPEQSVAQIGSKKFAQKNYFNEPSVSLKINCREDFTDLFQNQTAFQDFIEGDENNSTNFYAVIRDSRENDGVQLKEGSDVISFGNCFFNGVSLTQNVRGVLQASYDFVASNVQAQKLEHRVMYYNDFEDITPQDYRAGAYFDESHPMYTLGGFTADELEDGRGLTINHSGTDFNLGEGEGIAQSINASGMPGNRSLVLYDGAIINGIGFHGTRSSGTPSGGLLNQHSPYVVSGTFRTDYDQTKLDIAFVTGERNIGLGSAEASVRDTRGTSSLGQGTPFAVTGSFIGAPSGAITISTRKESGYYGLAVSTGSDAIPVVGGYTGGLSTHVSGIHSDFVYLHTGNFATANPAGFTFGEAFSGAILSGQGRLACIDNRLKYHKFTGGVGTNPPKGWIGLTDSPYYGGEETNSISTQSGKRAAYTWINGLPVGTGYYHQGLPVSGLTGNDVWHFPEPNNAAGSEHFIHNRGVGGIGLTGQYSWNDNQDGSRQSGFFVERVTTSTYISDLTIKKLDEFQITAPSLDLTGTQTQYITGFFEKDRYDGHKLVFQSDFLNTYKNRINNGIAFRSILRSNVEVNDVYSTGKSMYTLSEFNFEGVTTLIKDEPTLTFNIEPVGGATDYPKFMGVRYGNARSHSDDISIEDGATYVVEGECRIISGGSNNKATCKVDFNDRSAEFRTSSTTFVPFRLTADTSQTPPFGTDPATSIEARRFLDIGVSSSNAAGDENTGPVAGEFKNLKVYKVAGDFKDRVIPGYTTNVSVKKNTFDPDEFVTVKLNQNVNPEEAAILFGLKSRYASNEYNDSDNLTEQLRIEIPRGNLVHNRVDLARGVALAKVVLVDGEFKLADSGKFDTYSSSLSSHQTRDEAHDFIDNVGEGEILAMITTDTIANGSSALGGITGRLASGFNSQLIGDYTHRDAFVFVGARGQNPIFEELSDDDAKLMQENSEQPQATVYLPTENHEFLVQSDAVQNFNLSLPISRKDIKSIGKRYPLTRKAMHPNEGNFSLTSLVSNTVSAGLQTDGFRTKTENLQTFTNQNTDYTVNISGEKLNSDTYQLKIKNAKLQQSSFNSQIGGALNSNMSFGFSKDDFQYIDTTFEDAYAYSLSRKMNSNYTGYAFQARRMWDNSLVGVGFNGYGVVSGDSPVTLLDSGFGTGIFSGTNLSDYVGREADNLADYKTFVPRIYSQGIPGNDLTGRPWDSGETFQVSFGDLYNSTWDDDISATKFALSGTRGAGLFPVAGRISPRDPVWTGNDNGTMFAFYKYYFGGTIGTRWVITEGEFIESSLSTGNLALRAFSNGANNPAIFYNRPWYFNETINRWTVFNPGSRPGDTGKDPGSDETISFTLLGDQYLSQPIIGNRNTNELLYYSSGGKLGIDFNDDGADVQMCSEYPIVASGGTIGCVIENDVLSQTNRTIWAFYTGTGSVSSGDNTYSRLYYSGGDTYDSTKIGYGAKFSGDIDNGRLFNSFDEVNPEIKLYNKHMDAVGGGSATGQLDYIVMHNTFNTEGNYAGNEINNQFILNGIQAQFSQDAMKKGVLTPVGGEILSVGGHSDDDTSKSEYFNGHLYELFVFTGSGRYQNSREYYTKELERFYDIPKRSAEISGGNNFE